MSGLCGICEPGREMDARGLEAMLEALALPGESKPEALGGRSVALGIARRWPFQQVAAIPGVRVAADADLCNGQELAGILAKEGFDASRMHVAELLARLYAVWGADCLGLLRGGFSLAVWDEKAQRLLLAIDQLGVKSLYWRREGGRILFAARVGAIRAAQCQPAEVNSAAVMQFLLLSAVPAPLTIYRGAEKLSPGVCLIYEAGQVHQRRYWDLEFPESENGDKHAWAETVREAMRAAVHAHLDGCVPERTGAYLSGGTDSSTVVAFMREKHSPVPTFSIFFEEAGYSEISFARTTAECFQTRRYEKLLSPQDASGAVSKITEYYDEPFANSSAIGAYHCALLAREGGMETLLAGDGGDELFAGNERYALNKYFALYHSLPAWTRRGLIEPLVGLLPQGHGWLSRPRRYVWRANIPNPRRLYSYDFFLNSEPKEIFEPDFLAQAPPETWLEIAEGHFRAARARSELNRLLYLDVKVTLADNDLRKVAGTAELAGIRVRFPLLDHRLAELSGRIPTPLKLKGFEKRYVFKQAMKNILPRTVLYKKKHGFGVPLSHWLSRDPRLNAMMQDLLRDARTRQRGYFRPGFFDRLVDQHRREDTKFYGEVIWLLMVLELWHRQHLERIRDSIHAA